MLATALTLHLLSAVVWVGGMFFAYLALRPAAVEVLEPPPRLTLWVAVFRRFFPWVWAAVVLLPATGWWMILSPARFGGLDTAPLYVHVMNGVGTLMILIYLHVYFAPFARLRRAVAAEDWPAGGRALGQIRRLVGLNLILGLLVIAVASGGRYVLGA